MTTTISKWGNSQGLRVSKEILNALNLSVGDKVHIFTENNRVIIEPLKKKIKYDIHELVAQLPKEHKPHEEFDQKMGIEEW